MTELTPRSLNDSLPCRIKLRKIIGWFSIQDPVCKVLADSSAMNDSVTERKNLSLTITGHLYMFCRQPGIVKSWSTAGVHKVWFAGQIWPAESYICLLTAFVCVCLENFNGTLVSRGTPVKKHRVRR